MRYILSMSSSRRLTRPPSVRCPWKEHFSAISARRAGSTPNACRFSGIPRDTKYALAAAMPRSACSSGVRPSPLTPPDFFRKAAEARQIVRHHIAAPGGKKHRQTCAMGYIVIHAAQIMLKLVGGPVSAAAHAHQIVLGKTAGPHQCGPGFIIVGMIKGQSFRR